MWWYAVLLYIVPEGKLTILHPYHLLDIFLLCPLDVSFPYVIRIIIYVHHLSCGTLYDALLFQGWQIQLFQSFFIDYIS